MEEIWKPIKGYESYEVSSFGNVRRKGARANLKPGKSDRGYLYVCLCIDSVKRMRAIHQLVAETFIANDRSLVEVDHIDRDKKNNRVDNLRWCTRSENMANVDYKPGETGQRYIYKVKDRYRVRIRNMRQTVSRYFDSFEDAIAFRDLVTE